MSELAVFVEDRRRAQLLVNELYLKIQEGSFKPAADERGMCHYLGDEDARCSIGMFLPLEFLKEHHWHFERSSVIHALEYIRDNYPEIDLSMFPESPHMLRSFQRIHDRSADECFGDEKTFLTLAHEYLKGFCRDFQLEVPHE